MLIATVVLSGVIGVYYQKVRQKEFVWNLFFGAKEEKEIATKKFEKLSIDFQIAILLREQKNGKGTARLTPFFKKIGRSAVPMILQEFETNLDEYFFERILTVLGEESVPGLVKALKQNKSKEFNEKMVKILSKIGKDSTPELIKILELEELETKLWACVALAEIGVTDEKAISFLVQALKVEDIKIKIKAAIALGKMNYEHSEEIIPILLEADLNEKGYTSYLGYINNRKASQDVLIKIGKKAVPFLIQKLKEKITNCERTSIFDILGWIGGDAQEAVPILIGAIESTEGGCEINPFDIAGALIGIARDKPEVILLLLEILKNRESDRARVLMAIRALGILQEKRAIPLLIERLKDYSTTINEQDAYQREIGVFLLKALEDFGSQAKEAIPVIKQAWNNGYIEYYHTEKALEKIELSNK